MKYLPHGLLLGYLALFVICGIAPYDRATWWAENIPIVLTVTAVVALHPRLRFSNTALVLMSVLVYLHTVGGHYTFERVPFGFVTDLFGFERNHYDRIAHVSVGFYAFAVAEVLWSRRLVRSVGVLLLSPIAAIFTVASLYEIIEWLYAAIEGGASGAAFLGSQGDPWDAQKDMLADGLGAVVTVAFFWWKHRKRLVADLRGTG